MEIKITPSTRRLLDGVAVWVSPLDGARFPHGVELVAELQIFFTVTQSLLDHKLHHRLGVVHGACAEPEWPQTRKRNHPRHREMDTSRVDGVKASLRDGTPRSHPKNVLRVEEHELDLAFEAQALDLTFRSALQRLCQGIPELLERVEVGRPVRICHQEQRSRVSRVVF